MAVPTARKSASPTRTERPAWTISPITTRSTRSSRLIANVRSVSDVGIAVIIAAILIARVGNVQLRAHAE